jgi:hypothetical protein
MTDSEFASPEVAMFWQYISASIDKMIALLPGLSPDQLAWRPAAPDTNGLDILATHILGNAEENIVETLCGQLVGRDRKTEFVVAGVTAESLQERWQELRPRIATALSSVPPEALLAPRDHPRRGSSSGREILLIVARHAAEHLGQAELTRDLLLAQTTQGR